MKAPKACRQCRESKRRCSRRISKLGDACDPCLKRRLPCAGHFLGRTSRNPALLLPNPYPVAEGKINAVACFIELSPRIVEQLVDYYLSRLHHCPHSLFHSAQLRRKVQQRSISRALLLALCSMGSRFSHDEHIRSLGPSLMGESKKLLLADLENICVENIQTCVLLANLCAAHLNPSSEALFFRTAVTMAQILEKSRPSGSLIDTEIWRRVWWALVMADCWASSGLGIPRQINDDELKLDLPMDEAVFEALSPQATELDLPWRPGLWAYMSSLVQLFGPIQDFNRRRVQGGVDITGLQQEVAALADKLVNWEETLPDEVKMKPINFEQFCRKGMGGPFVALHLGYYHYSTLLYFQFLEHEAASLSKTEEYCELCKHHASSYSKLLKLARQTEGCEVIYPTVGHMAVVSSSVLLHALLFGDEQDLQDAREDMTAHFEAIVELSRYWPNTSPMIQRLVTFQNFCLLSTDYRTHQMDGWMLKFLIEYSLPLEDKDLQPVRSGMDLELENFSSKTRIMTRQGRYTVFKS